MNREAESGRPAHSPSLHLRWITLWESVRPPSVVMSILRQLSFYSKNYIITWCDHSLIRLWVILDRGSLSCPGPVDSERILRSSRSEMEWEEEERVVAGCSKRPPPKSTSQVTSLSHPDRAERNLKLGMWLINFFLFFFQAVYFSPHTLVLSVIKSTVKKTKKQETATTKQSNMRWFSKEISYLWSYQFD